MGRHTAALMVWVHIIQQAVAALRTATAGPASGGSAEGDPTAARTWQIPEAEGQRWRWPAAAWPVAEAPTAAVYGCNNLRTYVL